MSEDLRRLVIDLEKAARVDVDARKLVQVEARSMKDDWRQAVTGARNLRGLPSAITYDTQDTPAGATAEVGYEKRGQGSLGNIVEFGGSRHGPIRPAGERVLRAGADRLEKYLSDLGADL